MSWVIMTQSPSSENWTLDLAQLIANWLYSQIKARLSFGSSIKFLDFFFKSVRLWLDSE